MATVGVKIRIGEDYDRTDSKLDTHKALELNQYQKALRLLLRAACFTISLYGSRLGGWLDHPGSLLMCLCAVCQMAVRNDSPA